MAYTTIDNPELYFQTKLFSGNGGTQSITLDGSENMRPDWVWIKNRGAVTNHELADSVRGVNKLLKSNDVDAEQDNSNKITSFDNNGFAVGNDANVNQSSHNIVAWNWSAGGSSPAITYTVKVVSDSGNKYRFDDFGTSAVTLDLQEGGTYTFDQSDSSNAGHPLRFSETSNGTHGGGSEYTTGVTTNGTPGSSGAYTRITVAASAPQLYYYCSSHSAMGGQANTNSTFGSSNFSGSIQSIASVGNTQGFSIVSYTGNGSAGATIGHGLGVVPSMIIQKIRSSTGNWLVYHHKNTSAPETDFLRFNTDNATADEITIFNDTAPTSSVFSVGTENTINGNGVTCIAYCFAEKQGYSKFGSYVGNGNSDGTFVYTGHSVAYVIIKRSSASGNSWRIYDNKRDTFNEMDNAVFGSTSAIEGNYNAIDFLSNGFKLRGTSAAINGSGSDYIFMSFSESPFVNSKGIPTNAR